jgi:uncharacterized protein YjlB
MALYELCVAAMIFSESGNFPSGPNFPLNSYFAVAKRTGTHEEKLAHGDGAGYSSAWQR